MKEIKEGMIICFKDLSTKNHEGIYEVVGICEYKNPVSRNWEPSVIYKSQKTNEMYVREMKDFLDKFREL